MTGRVYLVVRRVFHGDDLLDALCLGGCLCDRLDIAPGDESMDRSSQLPSRRDRAQRAVVELAIPLFEYGQ